jgi:hypothetical protein
MKKSTIAFVALAAALVCVSCSNNAVQDSSTSLGIASLSAPVVTVKAYDGWNYVTWNPVLNATGYRLYRYVDKNDGKGSLVDSSWTVKSFNYKGDLYEIDAVSHDNQLINGASYTYYVVATGVQADRASSTEVILSDSDILGDNCGSASATAVIPEMYSDLTPVTISTTNTGYKTDSDGTPYVALNYTTPNQMYANTISFARKSSGITESTSDYDYFNWTTKFSAKCTGYTYKYTLPAWGGDFTYKIISKWNPCTDYYGYASAEGSVTIPASGKYVPSITLTPAAKNITVAFNDVLGTASYSLYRANKTDYVFTKLDLTKATKQTTAAGYSYTYVDDAVTSGESYVYALAGTYDGAALLYQSGCVAEQDPFTGALTWTPNFAAFRGAEASDGTAAVDLSWSVEDGITYTLIRSTSFTDATKGSYSEKTIDVTGASTVNGVAYLTDTISKLAKTGTYTYYLYGTSSTTGIKSSVSDKISYNVASSALDITYAGIVDTNDDGLAEQVKFTITASNDIAVGDIKFYRAQVQPDKSDINKTTSVGNYEFLTAYASFTPILSKTDVGTDTTVYTYVDSTLTAEELAASPYAYAAETTASDGTNLTDTCVYNACETIPVLPDVQIMSVSTAKYTISWNTKYLTTVGTSTAEIATQAATMVVKTTYSDADSVDSVDSWTNVTGATLVDNTYYYTFTVTGNTAKEYYYVDVEFTNFAGTTKKTLQIVNTDWENPNVATSITAVTSGTVVTKYDGTTTPATTTSDVYLLIKTTATSSAKLTTGDYTVYYTELETGNIVYSEPYVKTVTKVASVMNGTTELNTGLVDAAAPVFYAGDPKNSSDTKVTLILVHVTDAAGNTVRAIVPKWW